MSFSLINAEMNLVGNYRMLRDLRTINPEGLPSTSLGTESCEHSFGLLIHFTRTRTTVTFSRHGFHMTSHTRCKILVIIYRIATYFKYKSKKLLKYITLVSIHVCTVSQLIFSSYLIYSIENFLFEPRKRKNKPNKKMRVLEITPPRLTGLSRHEQMGVPA